RRRSRPFLEPLEDRTAPTVKFIATGADAGGGPVVNVYYQNGAYRSSFYAYDPGFRGGVRVATADVDHDGYEDIITGAGPGGGPHVEVFSGYNLALIRSFFAYAANFTGGVAVAGGDTNNDGYADIFTAPSGLRSASSVNVFNGQTNGVQMWTRAFYSSL